MPNEVTYVDEKTNTKALKAIHGNNDVDFTTTLAIIERLQEAGILFREPAETRKLGPRTKAEEAADASGQTLAEASEASLPTV